jgi:hypothetical protein
MDIYFYSQTRKPLTKSKVKEPAAVGGFMPSTGDIFGVRVYSYPDYFESNWCAPSTIFSVSRPYKDMSCSGSPDSPKMSFIPILFTGTG